VRTVAAIWAHAAERGEDGHAYLVREADGTWRGISWSDAAAIADEIAAGFLARGIGSGDRVAILARTRLEWTCCDFALASIGAVSVPIYPTSSTLECAYILGNSGARAIVCEDESQVAKVAPIRATLEALDHVFTMEDTASNAVSLEQLRSEGKDHLRGRPSVVTELRAARPEDEVLTILYTSGTTGSPKGCVITQRHYGAMVEMVRGVPGLFVEGDRVLLFLPLAHNFARLTQYVGAAEGFTIAFCPEFSAVSQALLEVEPTILPSVPRLYEKVHAAIEASFAETTGPRRHLVDWAMAVGRRRSRLLCEGRHVPLRLASQHALADRLVLSKVRARLGGHLRYAISGGAPLAREVAEFFHALGVLILEGYGLTECTTASHMNRLDAYRFGTVGPPLPGVEARLLEDGEVLLRGENVFVGYYGDERATNEAITEDGWLRTGDIGTIDEDGFLTITDRKKDIIVTAGGKNVAPQPIEGLLRASPYVSQALLLGDRRPYVAALLTLDPDEVARAGLSADEARALVTQAVADVNAQLGRVEQVKRFRILEREFLAEEGELTPTLKLRRRVCEEHFRAEIDALYGAPGPST
jgi:long-chain acyl-CoA synthetase